jgi:glycerophosphoryl diester phosphodiesterase
MTDKNKSKKSKPLFVAHRGARDEAPENSRSAFDAALSYPVDGIEFDVRITRDGVPVIHHDRSLIRTSGSRKKIESLLFGELSQIDIGSRFSKKFKNERILTFEKTIDLYSKSTRLFVEIKSDEDDHLSEISRIVTIKVLETINKRVPLKYLANISVLSFNIQILDFARRKTPGLKYVYNLSESSIKKESYPSYINGLCLPVNKLSEAFTDKAGKGGYRVLTYTCNTPEHLKKALEAGADVIMTDKPGWLCGYLKG